MPKYLRSSTPELNRLRAAAGLIPIIESGLLDRKLTTQRAALMATFCEWAAEFAPNDEEGVRLAETVVNGLERLRQKI